MDFNLKLLLNNTYGDCLNTPTPEFDGSYRIQIPLIRIIESWLDDQIRGFSMAVSIYGNDAKLSISKLKSKDGLSLQFKRLYTRDKYDISLDTLATIPLQDIVHKYINNVNKENIIIKNALLSYQSYSVIIEYVIENQIKEPQSYLIKIEESVYTAKQFTIDYNAFTQLPVIENLRKLLDDNARVVYVRTLLEKPDKWSFVVKLSANQDGYKLISETKLPASYVLHNVIESDYIDRITDIEVRLSKIIITSKSETIYSNYNHEFTE